jgi:A/G-specific adenine glycosylase
VTPNGFEPQIAPRLLDWYDRMARVLPWRVAPADGARGIRPDPYHVWLSEIMLQQTTVAAVRSYFRRFLDRWPALADLAAAPEAEVMSEWAGLGYYARARNLMRTARAVAARPDAAFPEDEAGLRALPGIGPYTAAAIAAIAFNRRAVVVDGNVERVVARLFAVDTPLPKAKPAVTVLAAGITPDARPGDYAQAMMDLGATICTPRAPACPLCPLDSLCLARAKGIASDLPRKAPKPAKPVRQGRLWVARRSGDGAWLLETRPERGLLGGMPGFPGDGWDGNGTDTPPVAATWVEAGSVRHVFTHFALDLTVMAARVPDGEVPVRGAYRAGLSRSALPTLMRKAADVAASVLPPP